MLKALLVGVSVISIVSCGAPRIPQRTAEPLPEVVGVSNGSAPAQPTAQVAPQANKGVVVVGVSDGRAPAQPTSQVAPQTNNNGVVVVGVSDGRTPVQTSTQVTPQRSNGVEVLGTSDGSQIQTTTEPRSNVASTSSATVSGSTVQIGSFGSQANVDKNVSRLRAMGYNVSVVRVNGLQTVRVSPKPGQSISQLRSEMRSLGYSDAIIVR